MSAPEKPHGGLVENMLESMTAWLRLACASVRQARQAQETGSKAVEAELHEAATYRYEEAARYAEKVAEACRIQAAYHRELAGICRKRSPGLSIEPSPAGEG